MIKHIVIFKLEPPYTRKEKDASLKELLDIFEPLGRKLGFPLEYRVAVSVLNAEYAGDLVIDSLFATPEDLQRYQLSAEHQEAVSRASSIKKTKTIVDYIL